jgi:hypothetical protein
MLLTKSNIDQYAKAIIDFCHEHHLAGVDLDYKEFDRNKPWSVSSSMLSKLWMKQWL